MISIEFAGLALFATRGPRSVSVRLPNPASRARQQHDHAGSKHVCVLLIPDHEGLKGDPDFIVTHAGSKREHAGWLLRGEVKITGRITSTDAEHDLPDLVNIRELAEQSKLNGPDEELLSAWIELEQCVCESSGERQTVAFADEQTKKSCKPKRFRTRVACHLGHFNENLQISIDGEKTIEISKSVDRPLVISNLTVGGGQVGHFGFYYELMSDCKHRPTPKKTNKYTTDWPENPDECLTVHYPM